MAIGQTSFPGSLDTFSTLLRLGLGVETELKQDVTAAMTTIRVGNPALLSSPDGVILLKNEWITYSAISGDTLTVQTRGAFQSDGGYPASAHTNGARIRQAMTPMHHRVLAEAIIAIETLIGQGRLVDLTDVQIGALSGNESIFWDEAQQKWIAFIPYFGDQANTSALWSALDGQVVAWDTPTAQWIPVSATGIDGFSEAVQDAVGTLIADSTSIDATYNDAGNLETLAVLYGGAGAASTAARSDHHHNADSALVHPTGSIVMYGGAAAPTGWLLCDGSAVNRTTFAALFTAIGTAYGAGDGSTTFNVPNFKSRMPLGLDPAETANDTRGETGGARTHTLTASESGVPAHQHAVTGITVGQSGAHTHTGPTFGTQNNTQAGGSGDRLTQQLAGSGGLSTGGASATHNHTLTGNVDNNSAAGASAAHNNMPPFLVVNFLIKS